jgi:hypothetical protein
MRKREKKGEKWSSVRNLKTKKSSKEWIREQDVVPGVLRERLPVDTMTD